MLSGLFEPSSGSAYIAGYNIRTDIQQIYLNIGLCPQFDVLWYFII
jgi:ABC-type multidrug transport system ATPase subunit